MSREMLDLSAFADVYEELYDDINGAIEAVTATMAAFQGRADDLGIEEMEERRVQYKRLQLSTLRGADPQPWLDVLDMEGRAYARLGMSFGDWMALTGVSRQVIRRHIVNEPRQSELLDAMDAHYDMAIAAIGQSYVREKEQMAAEAQRNLDAYTALFEGAPMGIGIWEWPDRSSLGSMTLVAMNPAGRLEGSRTYETLIGRPFSECFPEILLTEIPALYAKCIEQKVAIEHTYLRATDGRSFRLHAFPVLDAYVGAVFLDVTSEVKARTMVQDQADALVASNHELARFAYVASHDLRSPLRDLANLSQWVLDDERDHISPESVGHLESLHQRVSRLERLLDDLLTYSRLGRMREIEVARQVNVRDVVADVFALTARAGFAFEVVGDAVVTLAVAPLELVLRNLVSNAVKHHDKSTGTVVVHISCVPASSLTLVVDDDGPGIPEAYREQVFEMFETLRPRDEVEGSGMGLAMAKRLVTQRGGTIEIDASPRGGCRFTVTWTLGAP